MVAHDMINKTLTKENMPTDEMRQEGSGKDNNYVQSRPGMSQIIFVTRRNTMLLKKYNHLPRPKTRLMRAYWSAFIEEGRWTTSIQCGHEEMLLAQSSAIRGTSSFAADQQKQSRVNETHIMVL